MRELNQRKEETGEKARLREKELRAFLETTTAVLEDADFEITARKIFDTCSELIGSSSGYIALLSNDGAENEVLFLEAGGRPCSVDPELPMPIRGLRAESYKTGKAVCENDFHNSSWMEYMPHGHVRLDNVLFAPLNVNGKTVGLMGLANKPGGFDEHDLEIATVFGEIAAIALKTSRSRQALEKSEEMLRDILNGIPDVILRLDTGLKILWANRQARKIIKDATGKTCFEAVANAQKPCLGCPLTRALRSGNIEQGLIRKKDINGFPGQTYWMETSVPLKDENGVIESFIQVSKNVTDRIEAEREKEKLEQQLLQAQKMEAIGQLAGGVAHDFNNMLTVIMGNTNIMMLERDEEGGGSQELRDIMEAAERAKDLTMKLLTFARREKINVRSFKISEILKNITRILERSFPGSIALETGEPCDCAVQIDAEQVYQALVNICNNAVEAMPEGGTVRIETQNVSIDVAARTDNPDIKPGDYCRISISDTGPGIQEEILNNIFEPFFTTKGIGEGAGLGLSTTLGIIRNHQGCIEVHNEPGGGARFDVFLPAVLPDAEKTAENRRARLERGSETILVVDDEQTVAKIAERILGMAGYRTLLAESGPEAVGLYRKRMTDIAMVLLDVVMPGMDGAEVFRELRDIDPGVKVIFASGYTADCEAVRAIEESGQFFVQKPYSALDLCAAVRRVIDG